ncbi:MAG: dihydrodipicolinate synthase family protein [Gemmatimonadota bacterium]|nr:dihydrodipicolinate synthase family protein [Gemmatimonadota bacterium]
MDDATRALLTRGCAIPAHPLALTAVRTLDERRQRALTRYYVAAGAGGIAVGVHTTQFAIRDRGLLEPVLALAIETVRAELARAPRPFVRIAGAIGPTSQAVREAEIAAKLGYDCVLLSLGALPKATDDELIAHCRAVAEVLPLFGFYLQTAVGGRPLSYDFWRRFAEIDQVCAVKIAPFNRYQTLDVVRAIADSGREDIALYTGNDDNIVADLVTPCDSARGRRWIVGGLLGQFAVWTSRAAGFVNLAREARETGKVDRALLADGAALTDANGALFDVRHNFAGCIAGLHEILRRQGLFEGRWCLDPNEDLSPGQIDEIDRVERAYPQLTDNAFVAEHRDRWLS